jgi:hypothetical protein
MLANRIRTSGAHARVASLVCGVAVVLSACGTTVAQQSEAGLESYDQARGQIAAGSFSLDYDTARHLGRLDTGAGSFSLDYDTAQHMGRLFTGAGSSSLDYDTARHMDRLPGLAQ